MYLVRLTSESKPVHSRYSRLSQAWRTAEPIRIISAVSNWFRRRTSHELNFNTRFQLPSFLRAVKYHFNILVNSQMQCSHVIQTQTQKCDGMHINFDAVCKGDSKFARETSKTQTALIGSIFSDERKPPFWCADAQFILLRILRSSKYIKNTLN